MYTISNDSLTVTVNEEGAELTSIKYNDTEYLWNGDKKYWGRHAPVLFPIVGSLKDNKCTIKGSEYEMTQHGFARDMKFGLLAKAKDSICFLLESNEETLKKYPFEFELYVKYELNVHSVIVTYEVVNSGNNAMFFSIGGHPAFNLFSDISDYYIEFEENEVQKKVFVENGLVNFSDKIRLNNENKIKLDKNSFNDDAMIFKDLASSKVWLKSNKTDKAICMNIAGFPYLGIWSKKEGAPFVCLEPWFGIADTINHGGDFSKKEGIIELNIGEEFSASYSIEVI